MPTPLRRVSIGGVKVSKSTWQLLESHLRCDFRRPRNALYVGFYGSLLRQALRDPQYAADLRGAEVVYPDGMSVQWACNILDRDTPCERTATTDLWEPLISWTAEARVPVVLVGGTRDVNRAVADRATQLGATVALNVHGYFGNEGDRAEVIRAVRSVPGACVLVGLGSGTQERFVYDAQRVGASSQTFLTVGGLFDHISGVTRRAPARVQKAGLEWLWRVAQEPVRLGPRYLKGNASFVLAVGRALLSSRGGSAAK